MEAFLQELLKPIPATIWLGIGAVAAHIWRRYRNRMITLRWEAHHQSVAVSAEDARFGKIEVLYNSVPVQNVYMTFVRVENESTTDLSDLDLNLVYGDGSVIQTATGAVSGSANALLFSPAFMAHVEQLNTLPESDPNYSALISHLTCRRDFRVPVLNRGASLDVALLVQAPPGKMPFINVSCDYPSVRMVARGPRQLVFGVEQQRASITGLLAGLLAIIFLASWLTAPGVLAFVSFIVGAFAQLIGAAVIRVLRLIGRALT